MADNRRTEEEIERWRNEMLLSAGFEPGAEFYRLHPIGFGIERFGRALTGVGRDRDVPLEYRQEYSNGEKKFWRLDVVPDLIERIPADPRDADYVIWDRERWHVRGQFGSAVEDDVRRDVVCVQLFLPTDPDDAYIEHGLIQIVREEHRIPRYLRWHRSPPVTPDRRELYQG